MESLYLPSAIDKEIIWVPGWNPDITVLPNPWQREVPVQDELAPLLQACSKSAHHGGTSWQSSWGILKMQNTVIWYQEYYRIHHMPPPHPHLTKMRCKQPLILCIHSKSSFPLPKQNPELHSLLLMLTYTVIGSCATWEKAASQKQKGKNSKVSVLASSQVS